MKILKDFIRFLKEIGIDYNFEPPFLDNLFFMKENRIYSYKNIRDILIKIILDKYEIYRPIIKDITSKLLEVKSVHLSSVQKDLIEKYLCYKDSLYLEKVVFYEKKKNINEKLDIKTLKEIIETYIYPDEEKIAINKFLNYFRNQKNKDNVLAPIFARLVYEVYLKKISFKDFLNIVNKSKYNSLYPNFLNSLNIDPEKRYDYNYLVKLLTESFKKSYIEKKYYHLIVLELDQNLYNKYNNYEEFINTIFKLIKYAYENLNNHRYLTIYINDIIDETNTNIRWKIYSDIILFSTKFNTFSDVERFKYFYKPEEIYDEYISYIKQKYEYKSTLNLDDFKYLNYGFKYIDTLVLKNEKLKIHQQSEIISDLENEYDIAIILEKKEFNFNPIPCPACGSLKVSGNSFPEIGTRSWECKNPFCPERSKTNRGKRFSEKTYLTQSEEIYEYNDNFIEKEFIKKWRKDIVEKATFSDFIEMSIKYYSLAMNNVLILTNQKPLYFQRYNRNINVLNLLEQIENIEGININIEVNNYNNFLNKFLINLDISNKVIKEYFSNIKSVKDAKFEIYNGDSYIILQGEIPKVKGMVTSPPYYNAREYSNWENIYLYLVDIYQIVRKAYEKLLDKGIFLFNIGDVNDNEHIIKSKMGEGKIPLGAYSIKLFEKAGFSTLDCIIWSKGEPESNRHFNQGNYIPFFQKPLNSFEFIFIFHKKSNNISKINTVKNIRKNIHEFSPVIKISNNGENKIGHSAPFPEEIPNLLIDGFLSEGEDSLLDPFAGIGTSLIAGLKKNKYVIGIELNKKYFDIMYKKLKKFKI